MLIEQGGSDKSGLSTDEKLDELIALFAVPFDVNVLSGGGTEPFTTPVNTVLTLTTANTAYLCPASEQASRKAIQIYNKSAYDVFIGSSSVTTTNGILLPAGGVMSLDAASGIYAVCATNSVDINICEIK